MKKPVPEISIVVPVYKVEAFIGRCAESLFKQGLEGVEYIFVDDATPDCSMEVLHQMAALYPQCALQIKIIRHETNRGVSAARNTGLDAANGKYVCFVDGDDWVNPGYLENFMRRSSAADVCVCGYAVKDMTYGLPDRMYVGADLGRCIYEMEGKGLLGTVWNKCFRMDVIRKYKLRFNEEMKFWEDRVFVLHYLLVSESMAVSEGVYYNYEDRSDSAVKQTIPFNSVICYLYAMNRLLLRLQGTEYLLRVCQQAFIYIVLCVNSVYVDGSVSRKDRMFLLREVEKVMGHCPRRFLNHELINFKIICMYRILLLQQMGLKDCLLNVLGLIRKIEIKIKH
jgi:glycosyltransferase involved in cell wall biosynthesis